MVLISMNSKMMQFSVYNIIYGGLDVMCYDNIDTKSISDNQLGILSVALDIGYRSSKGKSGCPNLLVKAVAYVNLHSLKIL